MERLLVLVLALLMVACSPRGVDYADSKHVDAWLRHPVYGDPSFDAFEPGEGNPIHRGTAEFAWPVNCFLFADPVGGNFYAYVGEYQANYGGGRSRCRLYRSADRGKSWQDVGVVLAGDPATFDRGGHTPDVSVVYDGGRYHMVYDWGEPDFNREGGLAYAWAERPEGPWHRAKEPITRRTTTAVFGGRYGRTYAGTLIRRERDWLILGMTDVPPNAWAMYAMTAKRPEGPYGEPVLVRRPEGKYYHPPLMEFYPAFVHDGYVYAPATSVAMNRNFGCIFRAPVERATDEAAWEIYRHGSVWHAGEAGHEHFGIWGQTLSGQVTRDGVLHALFPSRDADGVGAISYAWRRWDRPLRERGFVMTGHGGPSLTVLRRGYSEPAIDAVFRFSGTVRVLLSHGGPLGPNAPTSDAVLHSLAVSDSLGLEVTARAWRVVRVDRAGKESVLAEGKRRESTRAAVRWEGGRLVLDGEPVWLGKVPAGAVGWYVGPWSRVEVERFRVSGRRAAGKASYLATEALSGVGRSGEGLREGAEFRYGVGAVVSGEVKWNVYGSRVVLWSPRGPGYGRVRLTLDGREVGEIDLRSARAEGARPVWDSGMVGDGPHALHVRGVDEVMPVDSVDVEGAR